MGKLRHIELKCLSQEHLTRSWSGWNSSLCLSDSKALISVASARVQSGARGDGFAFKEHQMVQCRAGGKAAPGWDGMSAPPNPQASDMGLMSLSVDIGPQAARLAGSIPGPSTPCTIPSVHTGLLTE